jgi:hypothetical protein
MHPKMKGKMMYFGKENLRELKVKVLNFLGNFRLGKIEFRDA